MKINDQSPEARIAAEARTANLLAYLAIAERRGARDEAARSLDAQIRARLGLDAEASR